MNSLVRGLHRHLRAGLSPRDALPAIQELLSQVHLRDVLGHDGPPRVRDPVTYCHVTGVEPSEQSGGFSVDIFFLQRGSVIPLHDHPRMCVASHVLSGRLGVASFGWRDPNDTPETVGEWRQAIVHGASIVDGPKTLTLDTENRNIHTLVVPPDAPEKVTTVLDVLTPPYGPDRACTYYLARADLNSSEPPTDMTPGVPVYLQSLPQAPDGFYTAPAPYRGQPIDSERTT